MVLIGTRSRINDHLYEVDLVISVLYIKKLRLREVEYPPQGHMALSSGVKENEVGLNSDIAEESRNSNIL